MPWEAKAGQAPDGDSVLVQEGKCTLGVHPTGSRVDAKEVCLTVKTGQAKFPAEFLELSPAGKGHLLALLHEVKVMQGSPGGRKGQVPVTEGRFCSVHHGNQILSSHSIANPEAGQAVDLGE